MISVKWMAAFVLCQTVFCIEQPYRLVKNTTCLGMDDQNRLSCKKSEEYHCLLDENYFNEYEVCREWKWIPIGKCAYFNTYNRGNVDERDCEQKPGYTCASDQHRSTQSKNYAACYVKKEITTQISPISTSSRVDGSSSGENSSLVEQTTPSISKQSHPGSVIGITFGFLIPVILAAFVILLLRKEIFQHCRKDSTEEEENNIDIEGHPNENAPLFEGNEQDIKRNVAENNEDLDKTDVEKGKKEAEGNESKEMERSSPVEDIEGILAKKNMEEAKKPSEREGNKDKYVEMHAEYKGVTNVSSESSSASSSNQSPEIVSKEEKKDLQNSKHMNVDSCGGEGNNGLVHKNGNLERTQNKTIGGSSSDMSLTDENRKGCELIQNSDGETINRQTKLGGNDEDGSTMNEEGNGGDGSTKNDEGNKDVGSTKNKEGNKEERSTENEDDDEENGSTNNVEGKEEDGSTENKEDKEENTSTNNEEDNEEDGSTKNEEDNEENGSTNNEEDNEEDGSTKNEDTGGVFDGSLESIKKKEDGLQQAGTDEFLELLKCGTIQTTKKILLNVVKENVANYPQSYQQNESEKEMVKELLPEDSKGFINSDLESVAVSYAILRLSLKKEHQPKSGWGQGIKDTDTGLGDDVERLYKVYTLFKGIQSAGEVTVNEYVKLYEILIDAFQRLGKREDYQEFVTGCENLQRRLWYMDKLKTIKRFLPNWSRGSGDSD